MGRRRQTTDENSVSPDLVAQFNANARKLPDGHVWSKPTTVKDLEERGVPNRALEERIDMQRRLMNERLKLPEPFPSSPHRPPVYSLKVSRRTNYIGAVTFAATYAAKHFLEAMIDDNDINWITDDTIAIGDTGVTVNEPKLEEIIEHKFTKRESEWQLVEPYKSWARSFITGEKPKIEIPARGSITCDDNTASRRSARTRNTRTENPDAPTRTRASVKRPDGLVSIGDICAQLKMNPRDARVILRKSADKPEHGWAWSQKDVPNIIKLLGGSDVKASTDNQTPKATKTRTQSVQAGSGSDTRKRKNDDTANQPNKNSAAHRNKGSNKSAGRARNAR